MVSLVNWQIPSSSFFYEFKILHVVFLKKNGKFCSSPSNGKSNKLVDVVALRAILSVLNWSLFTVLRSLRLYALLRLGPAPSFTNLRIYGFTLCCPLVLIHLARIYTHTVLRFAFVWYCSFLYEFTFLRFYVLLPFGPDPSCTNVRIYGFTACFLVVFALLLQICVFTVSRLAYWRILRLAFLPKRPPHGTLHA